MLSRVGDMFKFGRSTRMYILGGPTELMPEEGLTKKQHLVHGGVLTEAELVDLARLADDLEKHFGKPQDIEWAIAGGQTHLLQSRPVTTL